MIHEFHVQNYKALRDVKLKLTPMHVLIGPNDSGKTSILEARGALCRSVEMPLGEAFQGRWTGRDLVTYGAAEPIVSFEVMTDEFQYSLQVLFHEQQRSVRTHYEQVVFNHETNEYTSRPHQSHVCQRAGEASTTSKDVEAIIRRSLGNVHQYHWKPRSLALPAAPDQRRQMRMEHSGFGLVQWLDDIAGSQPSQYLELQERLRRVFPNVVKLSLATTHAYRIVKPSADVVEQLTDQDGRGLFFHFKGVENAIPASQVSDGLLLVLAYLTILYSPQPPSVLLLEEPENGIHPERLKEVIAILRDLVAEQGHTQVIMTTHSPYLVDLFQPDEVTLCVKDENGDVRVRQFSDIEKVRKQSKVFTMGEIWTGVGDVDLANDQTAESASATENEVTTP